MFDVFSSLFFLFCYGEVTASYIGNTIYRMCLCVYSVCGCMGFVLVCVDLVACVHLMCASVQTLRGGL